MQTWLLQLPHCQMGIGVPQYRSREMAQSTLLRSHSPKRPSLMWSGYQLIWLFCSTRSFFNAEVRMYHELLA